MPEKAAFRTAIRDLRKNHVRFPVRGEIGFFHLLLSVNGQRKTANLVFQTTLVCICRSASPGVCRELRVTHLDVDAAGAGM